MTIVDITKPMALDETLQGTNTKMDAVIQKLQGIIDALGLDTSVYKPKGNITCAALVPALLIDDNLGNVYNVTDNGTTTSDFVEGAGKPIHVGDNVAIVDVGTGGQSEYKFDLLAGMVDLTNYVQKSATPGLLKNDGTVDTKDYAEKVSGATNGNLAGLNGSGNLTDSGISGDMTTQSASGNPISIADLKSAQIALNPVITFEPIQAGSGTPSPSNVRAISGYDKIEVLTGGVNIFDEQLELGTYDTTTGEKSSSISNCLRSKNKYRIIPNEWYTLVYPSLSASNYVRFFIYDAAMNYLGTTNVTNSSFRITTANAAYIAFRLDTQYGTTYGNNISINYPSSLTTYIPYHKTTDLSESLGQTVYGAIWAVRDGKLVSAYAILNAKDISWNVSLNQARTVVTNAKAYEKPICSHYKGVTASWVSLQDNEIAYNGNEIRIRDDTNAVDSTTWTNYVNNNNIQILYKLATPIEIQLTPHEIALSQGYNYISTNGTSISLSYHNGELASLSDVAQVGETVENLIPVRKMYVGGTTDATGNYSVPNLPDVNGHATIPIIFQAISGSYDGVYSLFYSPQNSRWYLHAASWDGAKAAYGTTVKGYLYYIPSV